jgi:hypothetical protein
MSEIDCAGVRLPVLHQAANLASTEAQKKYLRLVNWNLWSLVVGAAAGAVVPPENIGGRLIAAAAVLALFSAFVTTLLIQTKSFERTWYGGRAVAESVKTLTWRYMVRAEPFDDAGGDAEQSGEDYDALFTRRIEQILEESEHLNVHLAAASGQQITREMREVRSWALPERRAFYTRCRIQEQQHWYTAKARESARAEGRLFTRMWIANALAAIAAVALVIWPTMPFNGTGLFATAAAAVFAWLQVKRHQETAQSYAVAAQELANVEARAPNISKERDFSIFAADAEAAISREHTLWVARRDAGITTASGLWRR